ncbi:MAG: DUF1573 domain-containing protein [Chitinophagaceae bacterium]|nr:DUF1573 domain-containing protein [Chitinophagaceae bacterium]
MKKVIFIFTVLAMTSSVASAQFNKKAKNKKNVAATTQTTTQTKKVDPATTVTSDVRTAAPTTTPNEVDKKMKFNTEVHDFGTVPEGGSISYDFEFKNISSEPIVLSNVQASCGCTTPTWPKEPVLKGKSAKITATYNTQGRPGGFNKTITITSNAGVKVVTIRGNVEKAPDASVPANNNSMIKK